MAGQLFALARLDVLGKQLVLTPVNISWESNVSVLVAQVGSCWFCKLCSMAGQGTPWRMLRAQVPACRHQLVLSHTCTFIGMHRAGQLIPAYTLLVIIVLRAI